MATEINHEKQEVRRTYKFVAVCMHNILAKIGKDKQTWLDMGYGQSDLSVEGLVGNVLKVLAEEGCQCAITGKPV